MKFVRISWEMPGNMGAVGIVANTHIATYSTIRLIVNTLRDDYPHLHPDQIIITHVDKEYWLYSGLVLVFARVEHVLDEYEDVLPGVVKV